MLVHRPTGIYEVNLLMFCQSKVDVILLLALGFFVPLYIGRKASIVLTILFNLESYLLVGTRLPLPMSISNELLHRGLMPSLSIKQRWDVIEDRHVMIHTK
jgi:hypothetical protein